MIRWDDNEEEDETLKEQIASFGTLGRDDEIIFVVSRKGRPSYEGFCSTCNSELFPRVYFLVSSRVKLFKVNGDRAFKSLEDAKKACENEVFSVLNEVPLE